MHAEVAAGLSINNDQVIPCSHLHCFLRALASAKIDCRPKSDGNIWGSDTFTKKSLHQQASFSHILILRSEVGKAVMAIKFCRGEWWSKNIVMESLPSAHNTLHSATLHREVATRLRICSYKPRHTPTQDRRANRHWAESNGPCFTTCQQPLAVLERIASSDRSVRQGDQCPHPTVYVCHSIATHACALPNRKNTPGGNGSNYRLNFGGNRSLIFQDQHSRSSTISPV